MGLQDLNILGLLNLIGNVVNLIFKLSKMQIKVFLECHIAAGSGLIKHGVSQLFLKLRILKGAVFDEWVQIIPEAFQSESLSIEQTVKLIGNFFGDVLRNLLNITIVLQEAAGNIQRKIRAVDDTF